MLNFQKLNVLGLTFRDAGTGEVVEDVLTKVKITRRKSILKYGSCEVSVGCDSLVRKRKATYVVVVAFRYGSEGVHYIYSKIEDVKPITKEQRLLNELHLSYNICSLLLMENILTQEDVFEVDFNSDDTFVSHVHLKTATGYAMALGMKFRCKPDALVAVKAADHHCV